MVLSLPIAGNIFFIKRLVDQIDATQKEVYALREDVASLKARVDILIKQERVGYLVGGRNRHPRVSN